MPRPSPLPSERRRFQDATGRMVTQWTSHPAMHHHFYFTNPTMSRDGSSLFGVTYRFRYPNLVAIDTGTGEIRVLTNRDDINAFSPAPDKDGRRIFYSAGDEVRVVETMSGSTRVLCKFDGGSLGNCSLSHDDKWLAISHRLSGARAVCRLMLIEVETGQARCVVEKVEVGHIQFHPQDASVLEYSGPSNARIWTVRADGSEDRLFYPQAPGEWITHESWSATGEEIIFTHWPHALRAVAFPGGETRVVTKINAWHACAAADGRRIVCDTNHPDRGLLLIDARSGKWRVLGTPGASNAGTQWRESTPAVGAGIDISIIRGHNPASDPAPDPSSLVSTYGPQWTHPHPRFSADGQSVIFTSDRDTGWSQIYQIESGPLL